MSVIICSDDDELISVGWIDTVRASLNDDQRQSQQHNHHEYFHYHGGQHQSDWQADVTSHAHVKPPRPITLVVLINILLYSPYHKYLHITVGYTQSHRPKFTHIHTHARACKV